VSPGSSSPRFISTASSVVSSSLGRVADSPATTLFLAAIVLFGAYWRVDLFISDSVAIGNALANLADGSLHFRTVYFGPADARTLGVYVADGRLYGRNYGQVVAALPILYFLRGVSLVAAPGLVLAGLWSVCQAALAGRLANAFGSPWLRAVGVGLATAAFLANVATGTALPARLLPLVALQAVTLLAAAGLAATMYALLAFLYDPRTGVVAGVGTLLLGPVGFWATIPKRHVVTAFLIILVAYLLVRNRETGRVRDRAAAYAPVGLVAWVSAPEGLLLLLALLPVDLVTAPRNDRRALAGVAAVLSLSMLPFFLTNALVSGNPLVPPRLLTFYRSAEVALLFDPSVAPSNPALASTSPSGASAGLGPSPPDFGAGPDGSAASAGSLWPGSVDEFVATLSSTVLAVTAAGAEASGQVWVQFRQGLDALAPERLYHVFIRSGRIPGVDYSQTGGEIIDLTMLESAPVLAALAAVPVAVLRGRRLRSAGTAILRRRVPSVAVATGGSAPARTMDLFAATFALVFTLAHLPRLPLHSTVTVRYLVPVVPFLFYGVLRLPTVRGLARDAPGRIARAAAVATTVGGTVWLAVFTVLDPTVGTLMQAHGVANVGTGGLVAAWLLVRPADDRVGVAVLGIATGAMALFLFGTGFEYFAADRRYLLPTARLVEAAIPINP